MTDQMYPVPANTPAKAPVPSFNPQDANYFDMFAPQYYNLETVQALMREGGGPLLRQVERVAVEYVFNPERGEDSGEWKPVIHFIGNGPALVVNQTRAKVLMKAARSIHVKDWHRVGWLEIAVGIENGQAQIVLTPANPSAGQSPSTGDDNGRTSALDEVGELLFGTR